MALGERAQRQVLTLAITTDLLELFHSGSHFLPAPDPHSMSTGASADHQTRWGQFKPSQWGQMRPSFLRGAWHRVPTCAPEVPHHAVVPIGQGMHYPADPPSIEEIVLVMRHADRAPGMRVYNAAKVMAERDKPDDWLDILRAGRQATITLVERVRPRWERPLKPMQGSGLPTCAPDDPHRSPIGHSPNTIRRRALVLARNRHYPELCGSHS
jgi:hypothetical protein